MPKPEQRPPKLATEPAVGTVGARLFRPLPELRARLVLGVKEALTRRGEEALGSSEEYAISAGRSVRSMKGEIIAGSRTKPQRRVDEPYIALQWLQPLASHLQPSRTRFSSSSACLLQRRRPQLPCWDWPDRVQREGTRVWPCGMWERPWATQKVLMLCQSKLLLAHLTSCGI